MSYQAVIRNTTNALVVNANVGVKISILQTTATGTVVFSEYHTPITNANGLVTLEIGGGTILTGNFTTINWVNGPYFIKTETDPTGPGTNYTISGTSQLLSVPFALYAASSGSSSSSWTTTGPNIANNNAGNVGIGTGLTIPSSLLTVKKTGQGFTQEDNSGTSKIGFFTNATDAFLQTHSNTDLSFTTNDGLAKMTLQKTTGNLGIGVTAPSEKLEVNGKIKATNLQVTTSAGAGKVLTSDAIGNATWTTPVLAGNSWTTIGTNIANNNTGNIGVGTGATVPSSLLTVKKNGIGFTQEDLSGATKIGFFTDASSAFVQTHSNTDMSFGTANGPARMTLQTGTGNVGISTTTPTEKLEVVGKTKTTSLQITGGAGVGKTLSTDAKGNITWVDTKRYWVGEIYKELGGLVIWANGDGTHGLVAATFDQGRGQWWDAQTIISNPNNHLDNSNGVSFRDWRLPTEYELSEMYNFRNVLGDSFNTKTYWSSTDSRLEVATMQNMSSLFNDQGADSKDSYYYIRAVRAF
jgi:hypothetical protein